MKRYRGINITYCIPNMKYVFSFITDICQSDWNINMYHHYDVKVSTILLNYDDHILTIILIFKEYIVLVPIDK